jgi:FkbM family methyltransferase
MIIVYKPPRVRSLLANVYRNIVLKTALKVLRQRSAYPAFWVMLGDIICREILLNGYYEKELLLAMASLVRDKSGTVLDVGANIGNHTIFFSKIFSQVICFEPVPRNCWVLRANLHLNSASNVTLVEKGLSDKTELLFLAEDDPNSTNDGLVQSPITNGKERPRVEVVKGDDALEQIPYASPIVMIKIDVEGMEPRVVRGLGQTIRRYRPAIFWEAFSVEGALATQSLLESYGYRYFGYLTTSRFKHYRLARLVNAFGKAVYLVPLDSVYRFDGMTCASPEPFQ